MTPERFRELWEACIDQPHIHILLREALTAFIHSEAMRQKAEHYLWIVHSCDKDKWLIADWIKASWEKWLGRMP